MDNDEYLPTKTEFLECCCYSSSHTLKFTIGMNEDIVYVSVHLPTKNFIRRIWTAVRHVFGFKSRYGDWDEFLLKREDKDRLVKILTERIEK